MALDFLAGCVGGAAGLLVGHPFDTVKVRIQMDDPKNPQYRGTFHCFSKIVKQESITGLYKGITSPLYGVAAMNAMFFGVYGLFNPWVKNQGKDALWAHFAAGAAAGAFQSVLAAPVELAKIRMQMVQSPTDALGKPVKGPSTWSVIRKSYVADGLRRGVFKGWCVTLSREIPGYGTYMATYEGFSRMYGPNMSTPVMLFAGGMAGVISWLSNFPVDVIKTRYQSDTEGRYTSAIDCYRKTVASEGYKALFRGLNSTVIRAFPTNAATFTAVTWVQSYAREVEKSEPFKDLERIFHFPAQVIHLDDQMSAFHSSRIPAYNSMCAWIPTNIQFQLQHSSTMSVPTPTSSSSSSSASELFLTQLEHEAGAEVQHGLKLEEKLVGPDSTVEEGSEHNNASHTHVQLAIDQVQEAEQGLGLLPVATQAQAREPGEGAGVKEEPDEQDKIKHEVERIPAFPLSSTHVQHAFRREMSPDSTPEVNTAPNQLNRRTSTVNTTTFATLPSAPVIKSGMAVGVAPPSGDRPVDSHAQGPRLPARNLLAALAQLLGLPLALIQQSLEGEPVSLLNLVVEWLLRTGNSLQLCECLSALDQCVCLGQSR